MFERRPARHPCRTRPFRPDRLRHYLRRFTRQCLRQCLRPARLAVLPLALAALVGCPLPPLVVLPDELPTGVEDRFYSEFLSIEEGVAARWSVSAGALPDGLTLDDETGELSGVPNDFGTFSFTIAVTDGQLAPRLGEQSYSLEILERLRVAADFDSLQVGVQDSLEIVATGGVEPYEFDVIGLPAGLNFDADTGVISGTPVIADPAVQLRITVTDSGDPQQARVTNVLLVIRPQPLAFVTTSLADATLDEPYSATIETVDGRAPVTFSVLDGLIPDGLRLDAETGEISGAPSEAGAFTFTIQAEDSDDPPTSITQEFTLTVLE